MLICHVICLDLLYLPISEYLTCTVSVTEESYLLFGNAPFINRVNFTGDEFDVVIHENNSLFFGIDYDSRYASVYIH